jgi:enamine deaminase RidA (YjgF/YER057c/UK114 family)
MQEQTRGALRNVETILKAAESSLERVVKVTAFLV